MELIIISRTKLKVMLSAEDMKKLDFDPLAGGDVSGRTAFKNILKEARDRCGFDAVGERVFVQYYPEKHGGCEMFVTKLTSEDKKNGFSKALAEAGCHKLHGESYIIYRFPRFEDLLAFCDVLKRKNYSGYSAFFVVDEKIRSYYLAFDRESVLAGEFGGVCMGTRTYHYIAEHGRQICTDAVNTLGNFA